MNSLKRKSQPEQPENSEDPENSEQLLRETKKPKLSPDPAQKVGNTPALKPIERNKSQSAENNARPQYDPADIGENNSQPEDGETPLASGEDTKSDSRASISSAPRKSKHTPSKAGKGTQPGKNKAGGRKNSEEIEWVIHTRDNNVPDPFGSHSTTHGKLPFPEVRLRYFAKFDKDVTTAALEKRYRTRYEEYCAEHPTYPKNIVYAPKPGSYKKKTGARKDNTVPTSQKAMNPNVASNDGSQTSTDMPTPRGVDTNHREKEGDDEHDKEEDDEHENEEDDEHEKEEDHERVERNSRLYRNGYGACNPPRHVTEAADIEKYFDLAEPIRDEERPYWTTITVENSRGKQCGQSAVPLQDLRASSSFYADKLAEVISMDCGVVEIKKRTLARYVDCISPVRKESLPEHDFAFPKIPNNDGTIRRTPVVSPISWTFAETNDLYVLASGLRDHHVCDLVLNHWRTMYWSGVHTEIEPAELNRLFDRTDSGDPGRQFWIDTLYHAGVGDEIVSGNGWHPAFVELMAHKKDHASGDTPPWIMSNQDFCLLYHRSHMRFQTCPKSSSGAGRVHQPNYVAIASRLLHAAYHPVRSAYVTEIEALSKILRQKHETLLYSDIGLMDIQHTSYEQDDSDTEDDMSGSDESESSDDDDEDDSDSDMEL